MKEVRLWKDVARGLAADLQCQMISCIYVMTQALLDIHTALFFVHLYLLSLTWFSRVDDH